MERNNNEIREQLEILREVYINSSIAKNNEIEDLRNQVEAQREEIEKLRRENKLLKKYIELKNTIIKKASAVLEGMI